MIKRKPKKIKRKYDIPRPMFDKWLVEIINDFRKENEKLYEEDRRLYALQERRYLMSEMLKRHNMLI